READLAGALDGGTKRVHSLLLNETVDVFENNDRVVDHDADHQGQGKHRHLVERITEGCDESECGNDRSRDRERRNDGRSEIPKEQEDNYRSEESAQYKVFFYGVKAVLDKLRLVADDCNFQVLGQIRNDLIH